MFSWLFAFGLLIDTDRFAQHVDTVEINQMYVEDDSQDSPLGGVKEYRRQTIWRDYSMEIRRWEWFKPGHLPGAGGVSEWRDSGKCYRVRPGRVIYTHTIGDDIEIGARVFRPQAERRELLVTPSGSRR